MTSFMARHGARLIDNGYRILPIVPGHKKPGRYSAGEWRDYADWSRHCERDTTDLEAMIWSRWPDAGIGIACGSVIAIDIDIRDPILAAQLEKLAREMLGDTPLMRIGLPPKRLLVYRAETLFGGIKAHPLEVLGLGNQFVGYGVHPVTQRVYEWPQDNPVDTDISSLPGVTEAQCRAWIEAALKLVPEELRSATLTAPQDGDGWRGPSDPRGTLAAIQEALEYLPNDDLQWDDWFRVGMALKGALGSEGWDIFAAWSAQSAKHDPATTAKLWRGLKPHSVGAGTIYWMAEQAGWTPSAEVILNGAVEEAMRGVSIELPPDLDDGGEEPEVEVEVEEVEVEVAAPQPVETPADTIAELLAQADGFLAGFVAWCNAKAHRPQPWLALGAGLALVGALAGRRYRTEDDGRTNLYVVGIADSGAGKDNARKRIKELLGHAGLDRYLGGEEFASGRAIYSALSNHPAKLFQVDEFGQTLRDMLGPKAPAHLREIWTNLTKLSTSSNTLIVGTEYTDQSARPRVDLLQPCAVLHATTVPGPFWQAMQSGSLFDGSLARYLVFETPYNYPDSRRPSLAPVPQSLIDGANAIAAGPTHHDFGASGDVMLAGIDIDPYVVPFDAGARKLDDEFLLAETTALRQAENSADTAQIARNREIANKVALIRAISRDPERPVITATDLAWAHRLTRFCIAKMMQEANANIADNEMDARHKRALALIRKAGPIGMNRSAFYKQTHWLGDARARGGILQALEEAGQIRRDVYKTKTKPREVLFASECYPGGPG